MPVIIESKKENLISQLPDSMLCEILVNLPTKDVVKTSILCRRWRNLWQYVPGLNLVIKMDYNVMFNFFKKLIDLNNGLCLQRVKLMYAGYPYAFRNTKLINVVVKQKIQHLDISVGNIRYARVKIPPTIYTSCERLVSLKLSRVIFPKRLKSISFPCLKIINLQESEFNDSLTMEMLVSSESLLSFCLTKTEGGGRCQKTVAMRTPRLNYLKLNNRCIQSITIINDLGSNVKLDVDGFITFGDSLWSFLILLSSVRDMTISSDFLQVMHKFSESESESLPQFHNLSILSVKGMRIKTWEHLLLFLESCPNLKSLVMEFQECLWGMDFSNVPHYVVSSFEFVEIKARYLSDMKRLSTYFLENARILKRLTLSLDTITEDDDMILKKLLRLRPRSNKCEVVVRCSTYISGCCLVQRVDTLGTYKPLFSFPCANGVCLDKV